MFSSPSAALLLALPVATIAVSLADFKPRASNLPSACEQIYTRSINGCSASDWTVGSSASSGCSQGCVQALSALTDEIQSACGNLNIQGENVVSAFLAGQGPQSLCSNAAQYLAGESYGSSASGMPASSSQSISTSCSTTTTSSSTFITSTTTSADSVILSGTVTASPAVTGSPNSPSSVSSILLDTSRQPSPSSTSASQGNLQTSTADSGGGSPFPTQSNSSSAMNPHLGIFAATLVTILYTLITAVG